MRKLIILLYYTEMINTWGKTSYEYYLEPNLEIRWYPKGVGNKSFSILIAEKNAKRSWVNTEATNAQLKHLVLAIWKATKIIV